MCPNRRLPRLDTAAPVAVLYPLTFQPIFKERVWGGRRLAELYGKELPPTVPIGESWEITDRPEGVSVIANGPFAGRDLRWLMEQQGSAVLGRAVQPGERFPWLIKLLDAVDDLSLQVHPPAHRAAELGGEPKTELWFIADTAGDAKLYVGLKHGITRAEFERRTADGTVADCFHVHHVRPGDVMFVPSGRVHALGRGNVVFEIQQNSDTTYRVFDWNRVGLDGRTRELHLAESLASIDFSDFEPAMVNEAWRTEGAASIRTLLRNALFDIEQVRLPSGESLGEIKSAGLPVVIGVVRGGIELAGGGETVRVPAGGFALVPGAVAEVNAKATEAAEFLRVAMPEVSR